METEKRRSDFTGTSRIVHKGPLKLYSVLLAGYGQNVYCDVYDGESTSEEQKCHLEALSGTSSQWGPGLDLLLNKGLYIEINRVEAKVTVTYSPVSR